MIPTPRFTNEEAERAHDEWRFNCGPSALAVMLGLTIEQVRSHMGDFEAKGYTNPTLMRAALTSAGARFRWTRFAPGMSQRMPEFGLARIQWAGPWTRRGVPPAAAYRHTHWVGSMYSPTLTDPHGVWDINALNNGSGWVSLGHWSNLVVPAILAACEPKASGAWWTTHFVEIQR